MVDLIYSLGPKIVTTMQRFSDFLDSNVVDGVRWLFGGDIPIWNIVYQFTIGNLLDLLSYIGVLDNFTVLDLLLGAGLTGVLLVRLGKFFTDLFT